MTEPFDLYNAVLTQYVDDPPWVALTKRIKVACDAHMQNTGESPMLVYLAPEDLDLYRTKTETKRLNILVGGWHLEAIEDALAEQGSLSVYGGRPL